MTQKLSLTVAALFSVLVACNNKPKETADAQQVTPLAVVKSTGDLPSFDIRDVNDKTVNLSSFAGKKVFVNLWASWCPPCKAELPSIEKLYNSVNKDKAVFVMISLDDNYLAGKNFLTRNNPALPFYYPAGQLPALFNVEGIPATFIFDETGKLIHRQDGMSKYDTDEFIQMLNN